MTMIPWITWPLRINTIRKRSLANTFGAKVRLKHGKPKPHQGWDFSAPVGTPVYAIGAGKVVFIAHGGDYGTRLCHSFEFGGRRLYAFYAHLQSVLVREGDTVAPHQHIAFTGATGNAVGLPRDEQHLHFEIREHPYLGKGLHGRLSPLKIFGVCPLKICIICDVFE